MTTKRDFTLILPLLDPAAMEHLIPLATTIAHSRGGLVLVLGVVEVPEEQPLNASVTAVQRMRETLLQHVAYCDGSVQTMVRVARSLHAGLVETVQETGAELLMLGWSRESFSAERLFGAPFEQLIAAPPCDLAIIKQDLKQPRRILLPTSGGPSLWLCGELASALAETSGGAVTLLSVADPGHPLAPDSREHLRDLQTLSTVAEWVERRGPALPAIQQEATFHNAVVIGATGRHNHAARTIGPLAEALLDATHGTVIVTCRKLTASEQQAIDHFEAVRDRSARVDRWFAENTFNADEFADVERLVALKQQQGLTISLVLPALNEAETIGPLIDTIKRALLDEMPLLDEIVVIDSRSTDATREIAAARGVPVAIHQDILPQYGAFTGKGEALWKSLHVTRGDIIVWIDTDIHNVHPRFVYGLIGPLLNDPRLHFTKGFYRRPIKTGAQIMETGGGRVTELTARPLFNLFYPELSGFIQPLAGEYAGRRAVLERQPFFTGYGVETGLLIDLLHDIGLEGMAQVDLQQRIHRNQELQGLSRMSFAIIQVIMERMEQRQRLHLLDPINQSLKLIREVEGGFQLDVRDIRDHERPPICAIPEYAERYQMVEADF
ncbi:MAG TPA: glucosyl-3-phosphoglycerate synthase [Herpetosiphonaceae bacterium]